jgi:hypothetical protein
MTKARKPENLPSIAEIRSLVSCDTEIGKMFWLGKEFDSRWNSKYAGKEAFCTDNKGGYLVGEIGGIAIYAHRVLWALVHGEWPDGEIDHINGNRRDNRLENLRLVTTQENLMNKGLQVNNSSGHVGVAFEKDRGKWKAFVKFDGKNINLGRFENIDDAIAARIAANVKYGYHENHGSVR